MFSNSSKDATQQQSKSTAAKKHHLRNQPSISTPTSAATNTNATNNNTNDTFKLNDANSRGWLESSSVQANQSRSLEKKSHHRKQTKELSQKDILGAVSVEDIFKLTEMTARLPEVTPQASTLKSKHKNHHRHTSEPSSSMQKPLEMSSTSSPNTTELPIITTSSDLITSSSSKSSLSSSLEPVQEHKRSSWLHRKKKDTNKSAAASIVDEFYQKNPKEDNVLSRIHSINITPLSDIKFGIKKASNQQKEPDVSEPESRRHSFDNHANTQDKGLDTREEIVLDEAKRGMHEKRPDFFLHVPNEGLDEERDQAHGFIEKQQPAEEQDDKEKEDVIIMKFDYFTLPTEVKGLIDAYEHKGKVERTRMVVKFRKGSSLASSSDNTSSLIQEEDDEEDYYDDEEEDDEVDGDDSTNKNVVYYRDLIVGECEKVNYRNNPVRDIAILATTLSDNIEFIKLIQLSSEDPPDQGPLLDLHVSMFGDQSSDVDISNEAEELDTILQNIQSRLVILDAFKKESNSFLQDHISTMESLNLYQRHDNEIPKLSRTYSQPSFTPYTEEPDSISYASSSSSSGSSFASSDSSSSSSSGVILRPTREMLSHRSSYNRHAQSMYIDHTEVKTSDPFTYRQEEISCLIKSLESELVEFKSSLQNTEDLVNDVQVDMDDFRNRMETYIKDIPESHYSALKKLEVDIESILSKRAKNPWLDTGYALLSYLLTLFALVVWIVIYVLKWGKKVVLFPRKLWRDYSEYLVERNKVVKKASMRSVAAGTSTSLFQRNNNQNRQRSAA
ncbi:hypothetical protein HMPREF1544_10718 [Mucor circinelloides 1006PhL]|uniref:Uncharacterized protein n=1 Tax=Mucor circinelloides f. circinelloides (strain 1006PhL) TaxID=1220926 RepID=S2IXT7_MUCC1|nr:hypothetical protein HMPREF1544_10718 [Mucor circinelloides 1006PhL]KAG1108775.1 hypothetical protein G6F42_015869 [Rhizopus arrhizus]